MSFPLSSSVILTATCMPNGDCVHRDEAWIEIFGQGELWAMLEAADQKTADLCFSEAATGSLVTQQFFMLNADDDDRRTSFLMDFIPVRMTSGIGNIGVQAVTLHAEVIGDIDMLNPAHIKAQTRRQRNEQLGKLTAGTIHELSKYLQIIMSYTELFPKNIDAPRALTTIQENTNQIKVAAKKTADIIRKIQDYLREADEQALEKIDINAVVTESVEICRPYWQNEPLRLGRKIELTTDLSNIGVISGPAGGMDEIILNMIYNAVDALPAGGTIHISTYKKGSNVVLLIQDSGVGMSENVIRQIYQPSFSTKGAMGNGMGLAICHGLVQAFNGILTVDSVVGKGTQFMMTFPPAEPPIKDPEQNVTKDLKVRHNARVLVVDDDEPVRMTLVRLLKLRKYEVWEAASGKEALERLDLLPVDIVFTDLAMEGMNGEQLGQEIRKRRPDMPIVLVTGFSEQEYVLFDEIIHKPYHINEIDAAIQDLVAQAKLD